MSKHTKISMKRTLVKSGNIMMAVVLLAVGVLTGDAGLAAKAATGDAAAQVRKTTMADPENIALNKSVAGALVRDTMHYYSITTDNKNVDYQFELHNDAAADDPDFSLLKINITVTAFRADGKYDYNQYLVSTWVDPQKSRTFLQTFSLKKNTRYLIELKPFYYSDTPYHFGVYQVSKTPAIKKVTPKKAKAKVKFAKVVSAKSYEIAVKKKGGSWKTYKTKKTTYTINKLKSKKKYWIRVRSVSAINGVKKYSAWSKAKTVKVK